MYIKMIIPIHNCKWPLHNLFINEILQKVNAKKRILATSICNIKIMNYLKKQIQPIISIIITYLTKHYTTYALM